VSCVISLSTGLTIIIPAHQCGRYLDAAVASAISCEPAQVLVADNASNDETGPILARWAELYPNVLRVIRRSVLCPLTENLNNLIRSVETPLSAGSMPTI
jgi:glycosyltransferase involved in cell wall biosynthesis